ncbi:hypothetical protein GJ744_005525 [Endocarpon pusillum]|uniref:Uncharacterized protein n=1 Tax=Endocarpon pusillum TaxID=364733 RepID=A0A8H7AP66_9EURO|nr:hypothetical protein GJ744_005525 [Endocarpon pusillum]
MAEPPFNIRDQLDSSPMQDTLPGFPNISLQNSHALEEFLGKEILVSELDDLTKHLPLPSNVSTAISPLHYHRFKARDIYIIEDPGIHLTRIFDRLFLKPIPRYLLSHAFWSTYVLLAQQAPSLVARHDPLRRAAKGFLRSYFYLIRYESDLHIAHEHGLLPDSVTWEKWCAFSARLDRIPDAEVSPRYRHGELDLPRLNWLAKIYLHRFRYRESHGRRGGNLRRFYEPLLFLFGVLSLILSAMQVGLAALPDLQISDSWVGFVRLCRWIAVVTLLGMGMLLLLLPAQYGLVLVSRILNVIC